MEWLHKHPGVRGALIVVAGLLAFATMLVTAGQINKARADGPTKRSQIAAPVQAQAPSTPDRWTGLSLWGSLGYAVQASDIEEVSLATHDLTYGVGIGYDHQFAGTNLLAGLGCDIDLSRAESAIASWDRQWSCWGRAGLLITPNVLGYGLVGYTQLDGGFQVPALADRHGLTIGGGLEALFRDGWFLALEGRWVDQRGDDAETNQYAAKLRMGYRFGGAK